MLVQVSQEHIAAGQPGAIRHDPVGRAVNELVKNPDFPLVNIVFSNSCGGGFFYREEQGKKRKDYEFIYVTFPADVQEKLREYIHGETLEPFSFEMQDLEWKVKEPEKRNE